MTQNQIEYRGNELTRQRNDEIRRSNLENESIGRKGNEVKMQQILADIAQQYLGHDFKVDEMAKQAYYDTLANKYRSGNILADAATRTSSIAALTADKVLRESDKSIPFNIQWIWDLFHSQN